MPQWKWLFGCRLTRPSNRVTSPNMLIMDLKKKWMKDDDFQFSGSRNSGKTFEYNCERRMENTNNRRKKGVSLTSPLLDIVLMFADALIIAADEASSGNRTWKPRGHLTIGWIQATTQTATASYVTPYVWGLGPFRECFSTVFNPTCFFHFVASLPALAERVFVCTVEYILSKVYF